MFTGPFELPGRHFASLTIVPTEAGFILLKRTRPSRPLLRGARASATLDEMLLVEEHHENVDHDGIREQLFTFPSLDALLEHVREHLCPPPKPDLTLHGGAHDPEREPAGPAGLTRRT